MNKQVDEEYRLYDLIAIAVPSFLSPTQTSAKPPAAMGYELIIFRSSCPNSSHPVGRNGSRFRTASTRCSGGVLRLFMGERSSLDGSNCDWSGSSMAQKGMSY